MWGFGAGFRRFSSLVCRTSLFGSGLATSNIPWPPHIARSSMDSAPFWEQKSCARQEPHLAANSSSGSRSWGAAGHRHNLQNSGPCALCAQLPETIQHLIAGCVFSREVWFILLWKSGRRSTLYRKLTASLSTGGSLIEGGSQRLNTFVLLVPWSLWKERNTRVFSAQALQPQVLVE
jgi:hypothetical protein